MDLTGNEHRCDPEKLEVDDWRLDLAEISIDETYSGLHRFWKQFELDLDNHEPINEYFTILRSQIRLHTKVIRYFLLLTWLDLTLEQVLVNVLNVVSLGQQVALRHPHVAYDVLSGQREDLVGIAQHSGVSLAATHQLLRECMFLTFAVILTPIIKFGILNLDQFIWSS